MGSGGGGPKEEWPGSGVSKVIKPRGANKKKKGSQNHEYAGMLSGENPKRHVLSDNDGKN